VRLYIVQAMQNDGEAEADEGVLQLECGHGFHLRCGLEWFHRYATNCPNCRSAVREPAESLQSGSR
jgi:hypothetical protein